MGNLCFFTGRGILVHGFFFFDFCAERSSERIVSRIVAAFRRLYSSRMTPTFVDQLHLGGVYFRGTALAELAFELVQIGQDCVVQPLEIEFIAQEVFEDLRFYAIALHSGKLVFFVKTVEIICFIL